MVKKSEAIHTNAVAEPANISYDQLLSRVQAYVRSFFKEHYNAYFVYHNIEHTERVAKAAKEISNHFQLTPHEFFLVMASAWFHDSGYFIDAENHEVKGGQLAVSYLEKQGLSAEETTIVKNCILATRVPQNPQSLLEKIVCDADLYHLGTADFFKNNELLFQEVRAIKDNPPTKAQWQKESIQLLENHHYFTDYCRLLLRDTKRESLKALRGNFELNGENAGETYTKASSKSEKKKKKKKPKKGIETMFRVASNTNQRLSKLADYKARNMITVNSIILSAIISLLLRKLDVYPYLTIPTYIILLVCIGALIFSIMATRPASLKGGQFTKEDLHDKKTNLLFFGNFYKMDLERYDEAMWEIMDDYDLLYGSLIKDVYYQGLVLARKFKLLRISYNIFMYGLIIAVLAFILATLVVPS